MNAPKTKALYDEHKFFANEEEATEAVCDFRDLCEMLEKENARLREAVESVRALCTTDHESKAAFISRVLRCLPNT